MNNSAELRATAVKLKSQTNCTLICVKLTTSFRPQKSSGAGIHLKLSPILNSSNVDEGLQGRRKNYADEAAAEENRLIVSSHHSPSARVAREAEKMTNFY